MEAVRIFHVRHLDSNSLKIFVALAFTRFALRLQIELAAPDANRSLLSAVLSLHHLVKEYGPLIIAVALEVSLGQAFLAELDGKIGSVWHLNVTKESTAFIGKEQLNRDLTLVKA